jgi:hypothetical protein
MRFGYSLKANKYTNLNKKINPSNRNDLYKIEIVFEFTLTVPLANSTVLDHWY